MIDYLGEDGTVGLDTQIAYIDFGGSIIFLGRDIFNVKSLLAKV